MHSIDPHTNEVLLLIKDGMETVPGWVQMCLV